MKRRTMHPKTVRVATVAITTFVPWLLTLAVFGVADGLARPLFVAVHYVFVVLLYGIAFGIYFRDRNGVDPFTVTIIAMLCLFVYEFISFTFFSEGPHGLLTYVDWLVPAFLIASTIYWTGIFFTKQQVY